MRRLTLLVDVDQPDGDWIWDSHSKGEMVKGVMVLGITESVLPSKTCNCINGVPRTSTGCPVHGLKY
jgi:hypothetical protein